MRFSTKKVGLGIAVLALVAQMVPVKRSNPPIDPSKNDFRHANCAILCKNCARTVMQELSFQRNCLAVV